MKKQNLFLLPAICWLIFSTVLLTLSQSSFPEKSWLSNIPWLDKWVHLGIFSILAMLLCWSVYKRRISPGKLKNSFFIIGIACLAYGIVMEFVQKYWVPNRSFDPGDIIADGVGAAAGVLFSFKRYIKNRPL